MAEQSKEKSHYFETMLKEGLPEHAYRLHTYEEAVKEFGIQTKSKVVLLPLAILLPEYHPTDIMELKPYARDAIKASLPSLKTIDIAFNTVKKKKVRKYLLERKENNEGKIIFNKLFQLLHYTSNESVIKSTQHIQLIAETIRLDYLHPLLLFYLGILNFKIGITAITDFKDKANERANNLRYTMKCYDLFLKYCKNLEDEFKKTDKEVDYQGILRIKQYIHQFKRRFPLKETLPDYKKLNKEMANISPNGALSYKLQYFRQCFQYFYFEGMLKAGKAIHEQKLSAFLKSESKTLAQDPTGSEYVTNTLYLMSLAYIHPKVDKTKIRKAVEFFNQIEQAHKIPIEEDKLHLALAQAAYKNERIKYAYFEGKFGGDPSMRSNLAFARLKGLAERSYRFELLKYDYYQLFPSQRSFKLTLKTLENIEDTIQKKQRWDYYTFMERIYQAMNRVSDMAKMHHKAAVYYHHSNKEISTEGK